MPRARVKPEDRQRSAIACLACKRAKIRCDAKDPCSNCSKRGREASCIYPISAGRTESYPYPRRNSYNLSNSVAGRGRGRKDFSESPHSQPGHLPALQRQDSEAAPPSPCVSDTSNRPEIEMPRSRMLLSSKLQKVYIGETASLSYLQFLRHVVKHRLGACAFTESDFNNYMLETQLTSSGNDSLETMNLRERHLLAQSYLDSTSGILDLHAKADIFTSLEDLHSSTNVLSSSVLYLILAIGSQCRGTSSDTLNATNLFVRGQRIAFEGMLCDPSIDMVRQFVLMSFYMLGACHRNGAFMYLGVASKAASALGMHKVEQYRDSSMEDHGELLNTWKSLRVLDTIVNSILGRSNPSSGMVSRNDRLEMLCQLSNAHNGARTITLQAIFDICPFIDKLECEGNNQDVSHVEQILQELQQWSKALPERLRSSTDTNVTTSTTTDREMSTGRTHVACVYYFAVIRATRKCMTIYLLNQLQEKAATVGLSSSSKPTSDEKISSLAHVCLKAAINLGKICYNAMKSGRMVQNMCLVKAWIFAAGLCVGFYLFANSSDTEANEAFSQIRAVLKHLALLSPQASHYFEILSSFSEAVTLYHRRLLDERRRMTSQYMDQIFTVSIGDELVDDPCALSTASTTVADLELNEATNEPDASAILDSNTFWGCNAPSSIYETTISQEFPWPADDLSVDWQSFAPFYSHM